MKQETGGGITDFISHILKMISYNEFLKRCKDKKINFVSLELDEKAITKRLNDLLKEEKDEDNKSGC